MNLSIRDRTVSGLFPWACTCGKTCYKDALQALTCRECRKAHAMTATNLITGEKRYLSYYLKTKTPDST